MKERLGRHGGCCEDNIKMYLKDTGWEGVDWIRLIQDTSNNAETNLRVPQNFGTFESC
jgi:hypothetical protein